MSASCKVRRDSSNIISVGTIILFFMYVDVIEHTRLHRIENKEGF